VALDNLDEVIHIIRKASSNAIASAGLRNGEFSFSFSSFFILPH
jgi:DNA gyrase/topoisomerase IV subunit A